MRTKITKLPPLHLACDNHPIRPAFQLIYFNKTIATATDAHIMIRYDLQNILREDVLQYLDGKTIHMNIWKNIKDAAMLRLMDGALMYAHPDFGMIKIKAEERTFEWGLKWEGVWNDCHETTPEPTQIIGMNWAFLATIGKIVNEPTKVFNIKIIKHHKAILVCGNEDKFRAIIMPCMVTADWFDPKHFEKFKA